MNNIKNTLNRLPVTRKELEEYTSLFNSYKEELNKEIEETDNKIKHLLDSTEYARTMEMIVLDLQTTVGIILNMNKQLKDDCDSYKYDICKLESKVMTLENRLSELSNVVSNIQMENRVK